MKVLVTGATGFAGSHLCEYLQNNTDAEVYGLGFRSAVTSSTTAKFAYCDLLNKDKLTGHIKAIKPDLIFHLAAIASVPEAWQNPERVLTNNVIGQLNIFEALVKLRLRPRVLVVSTGEVYGVVKKEDLPIDELAKIQPSNPYAVSKVTQEFLGFQYFKSHGIPVIIARSFNHSGPRQIGDFVVPAFTTQIVDVEQGKKAPVIYVGNLDAERDFLDVRDVVRAYWMLLEKGQPGEIYNVCSGETIKIKKVLDTLLSYSKEDIEVRPDPARTRPSDTPVVVGDNTKLRKATSWQPEIDFKDTLKDMLEYMHTASSSLKETRLSPLP